MIRNVVDLFDSSIFDENFKVVDFDKVGIAFPDRIKEGGDFVYTVDSSKTKGEFVFSDDSGSYLMFENRYWAGYGRYENWRFRVIPSFWIYEAYGFKGAFVARQLNYDERDLDMSFFADGLQSSSYTNIVNAGFNENLFSFSKIRGDKKALCIHPEWSYKNAKYVDYLLQFPKRQQEFAETTDVFEKHECASTERRLYKLEKTEEKQREDLQTSLMGYFNKKDQEDEDAAGPEDSEGNVYEESLVLAVKDTRPNTQPAFKLRLRTEATEDDDSPGPHLFAELKPGLYAGDYSEIYGGYADKEDCIKMAKWGFLYMSTILYDIKCTSRVIREEDKEEDEDEEDKQNDTDSSEQDANKKKKKKKYKYTRENCSIVVGSMTYDGLVGKNKSLGHISITHDNSVLTATDGRDIVVPVKGCSGFEYVIDSIKADTLAATRKFYTGTILPDLSFASNIMLKPRVRVKVCGTIASDEIKGKLGGSGPGGFLFLLKVPTVKNSILKDSYASDASSFGQDWYYCTAVLKLIKNEYSDMNGRPENIVQMDNDLYSSTPLPYFEEKVSFKKNEHGVFATDDGKFEIYGKPFKSMTAALDSYYATYGENTCGVMLAVSGKRNVEIAAGGIYDVKGDKYYMLDNPDYPIDLPGGSGGATNSSVVKTGYMYYDSNMHWVMLEYKGIAKANQLQNMLFMPTLALLKKMSMKFNQEGDNMAILKELPDRLYRLHVWSLFVNSVLDGKYVTKVGKLKWYEEIPGCESTGEGACEELKEEDGWYSDFEFPIKPDDRPAVFYGRIFNADLLDEIANEVIVASKRLLVKDHETVKKRNYEVLLRYDYPPTGMGRDSEYSRLDDSNEEKYEEEDAEVSIPYFKRYTDTLSAKDMIKAGASIYPDATSTAEAINSMKSRIELLEKIADFTVGDDSDEDRRIYAPETWSKDDDGNDIPPKISFPSISVSEPDNTDDQIVSYKGYKRPSKTSKIEVVGLDTLPGVKVEMVIAKETVEGLKAYNNINLWFDIKHVPDIYTPDGIDYIRVDERDECSAEESQYVDPMYGHCRPRYVYVKKGSCIVADTDQDGHETYRVDTCTFGGVAWRKDEQAEQYNYVTINEGDSYGKSNFETALDAHNTWVNTYGVDHYTHQWDLANGSYTDNTQFVWWDPSTVDFGLTYYKYLYTMTSLEEVVFTSRKPSVSIVKPSGADWDGFTTTDNHTVDIYPGDEGRFFSYSTQVDKCLPFEKDMAGEYHINGKYISKRSTFGKPDGLGTVFYDVTDFMKLSTASKYLGIPEEFSVQSQT